MFNELLRNVLVIAPHSDDDILGCGGMIKKVKDMGGTVNVLLATVGDVNFYHKEGIVTAETREAEFNKALDIVGADKREILFRHSEQRLHMLPIVDIITAIDLKIRELKPTAVFIPYPSFHQDHKTVFQAAFAALRPTPGTSHIKLVAMYEYPFVVWDTSEMDGHRFHIDITDTLEYKVAALREHKSQIREASHLISPETVELWAQRRGIEAGVKYAEAYKALRLII